MPIQDRRLRRLLRSLIDIYSPSGKEEDVIEFLRRYLEGHGLTVHLQPVDENRNNLLLLPANGQPRVALIGHVDTVSAYDLEDYGYQEQAGSVYGLGSADMKGGCAAMVEAFLSLREDGYGELPAALALVVGEEEDGDGTQKLTKDYHFPWALVGEPTELKPCLSHYGYLEIQLVARGHRKHASLANAGNNPVEAMLHIILAFTHYFQARHPDVVCNIRDLTSTQAGFVVPDRCEAWLDAHLPPAAPLGTIALDLEEILSRERQSRPHVAASLRFITIHSGYEMPPRGTVPELLQSIYAAHELPWQPEHFRSHSDANLLWQAGMKTLLIGPGSLERAHTPDESVPFEQVLTAARLYAEILKASDSF